MKKQTNGHHLKVLLLVFYKKVNALGFDDDSNNSTDLTALYENQTNISHEVMYKWGKTTIIEYPGPKSYASTSH